MSSQPSPSTPPLDYAPQRLPPFLDVVGDGVRLVMPPMPRWLAGLVVGGTCVCVPVAVATCSMVLYALLLGRTRTAGTMVFGAYVAASALFLVVGWVLMARRAVRSSRTRPVFEFANGTFTASFQTLVRARVVRIPFSDVDRVEATESPNPFGGFDVTVTVVLRPGSRIVRRFRARHQGFAGEVRAAFETALGRRPELPPLDGTG